MQFRLLRSPVALGLILAALIVIGALMFNLYQKYQRDKSAEHFTPLHLQPLTGPLLERTKFEVTQLWGADALSTTLPISATYQAIPFAQTLLPVEHTEPVAPDSDADEHVATVPVNGAYLVRFSNTQLCAPANQCPYTILAKADNDHLIEKPLMQIYAEKVLVSNRLRFGNPDLIIYPGGGMPPERLQWDQQDGYVRAHVTD